MKLARFFMASLVAATVSQAKTPVEMYGRLIAKGGALNDSTGNNNVVLRGMSMFWSSEPAGNAFYNSQAVQWLQSDWLVSIIRVPLAVERAPNSSPTNKAYVDDSATTVSRVLAMVNYCIAQGIYVVVDWHCPVTNPYTDRAVSLFRTLATMYKTTPNVMWEVWNEPAGAGYSSINNHANQVISAIRAAGNKNLVIVGSENWSSEPNNSQLNITDPASNVAYTLHFYAGSSAHDAYRGNMTSAIGMGRTVFVTEWGTTTADGNTYSGFGNSSTWLSALDAAKVSSCNWDIGDQLSDPTNNSSPVQGSAALKTTAGWTGSWTADDLTPSGSAVRGYLIGANQGLFTLPDTSLKVVQSLKVTPDTLQLSGTTANTSHISATFNRSFGWTLNLKGQTSGATFSYSGSGSSVVEDWVSGTKKLGPAFVAENVLVTIVATGTTTPVLSTTTLTLQGSVGVLARDLETAFAWTAEGLRLPTGNLTAGDICQVRVLDLQGRQLGAERIATVQADGSGLILNLAPVPRSAGIAFVELRGPDGKTSRYLLPPVR